MGKVKHINIKNSILTCAFCTHWYDPANSHIRPVNQFLGNWDCDMDVKSYCDVIRKQTLSQNTTAHILKGRYQSHEDNRRVTKRASLNCGGAESTEGTAHG